MPGLREAQTDLTGCSVVVLNVGNALAGPSDTTGRIGVVLLDQPPHKRDYALLVMFETYPECQGLAWRD
jgi:hypothetical protein